MNLNKVQYWSLVTLMICLTVAVGALVIYLEQSRGRSNVNVPIICKMYDELFDDECPLVAPPPPILGNGEQTVTS